MFEGWASDLLASYLGQFLEVQREQLRISLWSAWRTGLTMQNVAFRPGAFDHMQLPFKLSHGQIGTLQIHVPWRALRSPVVIDLSNVELTLSLLTPEDLSPDASSERDWAVKQAQLAAQELQELAAGVSSDSDGKPPPEAKQGGMLWSLVQHAVTMLLRRLHLSVTNVHVRVVDPTTNRSFGFKLGKLHTCLPGESDHPSLLLAEDAGVAVHASAAARGSIQKQIAAEGIQFYWKVGNNTLNTVPTRLIDGDDEEREASPELPLPVLPELPSNDSDDDSDWSILHSTDIVVHVTSKIIGSGRTDPINVHASALIQAVPVAIRPCQIKDILCGIDQINWTSAKAKHAHLRPPSTQPRDWRATWQYAVNAVLADLKGPLKAAPWRPPAQIQHDRRQYVFLYRKKLEVERAQEKKTEEAAAAVVASSDRPPLAETPESAQTPQQQLPPSPAPIRIGLSPIGEKRLVEFERLLCVQDIVICRSAAAHSLDSTSSTMTDRTTTTGGKKCSTSDEDNAGGGVFWGLAKAASFVGYGAGAATGTAGRADGGGIGSSSSPSSASTKASASALLPRPTASDVRELYEAVDFHPEEEEREKSSADEEEEEKGNETETSVDSTPSSKKRKTSIREEQEEGSWIELSVNCLLTEAKLTLKHNETGVPLAAICLQGLQTEIRLGGGGNDGDQGSIVDQNAQGESATSTPRSPSTTGLTAGVTLSNLYGLDYTSNSMTPLCGEKSEKIDPGGGVVFFGRGPSTDQPPPPPQSSSDTTTTTDNTTTSTTTVRPVLRSQYTASASKLDVLVQPLRLRLHPILLQTLAQFIPPAVEGSYVGSCMAALNALSDTSRAAYKAERLQKLGPPLDLVAKIVDIEVLLVSSSSNSSSTNSKDGGILLRTGAIVLHSVGQAASFAASEPIFKVLGHLRDVMLGEGTTRNELGSAVEVVEKRLVYQQIDFSVAAIQLMAISPSSSTATTRKTSFSPEIEILSNFLLPAQQGEKDQTTNTLRQHQAPAVAPPLTPTDVVSVILYPLKLSGSVKSHRLALDFGVPQLLVKLDVDPVKATVQYEDVKSIMDIMAPTGSGGDGSSVAPSPPAAASTEEVVTTNVPALQLAGPVETSIDLSLSSIDIHYADVGGFMSHFSLKKGSLNFQAHAPSTTSASGEVTIKLHLDSLLLEDSSSHPSVACALPAVLSPVYRLGKKVWIGSVGVDVLPMMVVDGVKAIDVQLEDIVLDGFNEEPGNFIARNNDKESTHVSIFITETTHLHRTAVAISNVSLGHTTILRILAMIFGPAHGVEEELEQMAVDPEEEIPISGSSPTPPPPPPPAPLPPTTTTSKTSEIAIDLHNCCLVCRYQDPLPGSNISVPGQVQDYFFVLKDMLVIELPRMSLNLPFLLENCADQGSRGRGGSSDSSVPLLILENVELIMATTGVPGYYLLPVLRFPSVVVERQLVKIGNSSSHSSAAAAASKERDSWCQVLKVNAPCVEVGVHPSHLIIGTLAMQLLQQELIALLGGTLSPEDVVENIITRARTPSPSKAVAGGHRASEMTTPREWAESESSDVFLSPPGLGASPLVRPAATPPVPAAATMAATTELQAAPTVLWRLETTVGLVSVSLLGSLLTSTCLKLEWHRISSTISNIPLSENEEENSSSSSTGLASSLASSPTATTTATTATIAWSHLTIHVLRPKDTGEIMESFTPFHGMNGFFSTPQLSLGGGGGGLGPDTGPGSVLSGAGGGGAPVGLNPLRPGVTPPSQIVPGIASAAGAGMHRLSSFASAAEGGIDQEDEEEVQETSAVSASASAPLAAVNTSSNYVERQNSPSIENSPSGTPSFADARSVMLSRFSGSTAGGGSGGSFGFGGAGSVISRHFSVHESELYEDAASELLLPDGSIIRSPDGRSPRQPLKPLLPLDLESSDFEVDLLVKFVSTTTTTFSSQAVEQQNVVFTQHAQHINLALESLNLRVYLHGWQHLVECIQNYEDFKVQAIGRVAEASAGWGQLGALLSGEEERGEEVAVSSASEQQQQTHFRLDAKQLTIEAVAAAGSHPGQTEEQEHEQHTARTAATNNNNAAPHSDSSRIVPAGQIMLQLSAEIQQGPDGARFMVALPAALLRVGPIHLDEILGDIVTNNSSDYNSNSPLVFGPGDPILGLKNAEITASSETFEFFETSSAGDAAVAVTSSSAAALRTRRSLDALAISLQHASVWAGQRNLCSAAALGQHVAYMVAEITSLQTALASQQQQHHHGHRHHNKHGGVPLGSSDGVIQSGIVAVAADAYGGGGTTVDGTAAMLTTTTPGAGVVYEEHHTAINVEIESIAIALQCERLEDSGSLISNDANSAATTTTAGTATATATTEVSPSPLFELSLSKISIQSTDRGDGGSSGIAMLQVGLDVFNGSKMAWESVIDPWGACLNFTIPRLSNTPSSTNGTSTGTSNPYASLRGGPSSNFQQQATSNSNSRHLKLEVVSNQNFEATVTAAVTDAAAAAGAILSHIPAVVLEPDTLNQHIVPDNSIAAAASLPVTFQLNNLTGADVEIWLEAPLPGGMVPARPPVGPLTMCLSPSGRAVLPVLPLYQGIAWRSRRAGKPSLTQGVEFDTSSTDRNGDVEDNEEENVNINNSISQRRTLLYFRFSGQQGPLSGPVFLDKPGAVSYAVHVANPNEPQVASLLNAAAARAAAIGSSPSSSSPSLSSAAHVVAETAERRHGSFTAVLHSGVCISNTTPIDLDVGITQAAAGGGGRSGSADQPLSFLGVLRSGESTWLPAARAEMGLLHVRPTASYRPQVAERMPQSARVLPPVPTRHPAATATTTPTAVGAAGIGLSSGVHPSPAVSSGSSGVVYRSGAGNSTVTPSTGTTQTYSPAGIFTYGTTAFTSTGTSNSISTPGGSGHLFGWSAGLSLSQLIRQQGSGGGGNSGATIDGEGSNHGGISATIKQISCAPTSSISSSSLGDSSSPLLLTVGATLQGMSWNLAFAPPFTLHNALPVPVDITIIPKRSTFATTTSSTATAPGLTAYPLRLHLLPNDRAPMLHLNAAYVESVSVRPEGFEMTSPLAINEKSSLQSSAPATVSVSASEADMAGAWQFHSLSGTDKNGTIGGSTSSGGDDTVSISLAGLLLGNHNGSLHTTPTAGENSPHLLLPLGPEIVATVQELPPGRSTVDVSIQHALSVATGSHLLRLSCGMWIYNCIGVPLSIRNASLEDSLLAEAVAHQGGNALDTSEQDLIMLSIDDHVPDSWVPPLDISFASGSGAGGGGAITGEGNLLYYGEIQPSPAGDYKLSYRSGMGVASPLSTYRTGGGLTARGGGGGAGAAELRTPRPNSARDHGPGRTGSMVTVGRTASNADVPGLSEILETSGTGSSGGGGGGGGGGGLNTARSTGIAGITPSPLNTSRSSVLGYQQGPLSSRARGIAESMDSSPTFERPSAWPSMASGLSHGSAHRLRLQLRSAATKAPPGRTFWSPTVDLDASGAAVVTSIPSPAPAGAAVAAAADGLVPAALRGSYPIVVTSTQVPGADGVLALCISPQFVLRNALDMPIQYKQQGSTAGEREVPPGGSRAIRWADDSLPPRLCVRVQEAGWIWSGGFQLDVPGDIFVKSRHRDRGITMLLRVDVAISASGSAQITLSHNPAGFAPYRVENCSTETLHARQKSVREQQDVLRPYCALNYAWDEPTQPHILVLELPGARNLGNFDLDKVGQDRILPLPSTRRGEPDKTLRVVVRAEGPTRVLTVIDEKVHVMRPLFATTSTATTTAAAPQGISTTTPETAAAELMVKKQPAPVSDLSLTGGLPIWEIIVDLSSVGISLVSATQEAAYLRLTGARVTAAAGAARHSLGLTVKGIQLDNPSPWVAFPVTLVLPAPVSRLGSSMAAAVEMTPAPALQVLVSLWQRRPAGVLCVEVAQFQMRSVAVYLDQQHLEEVAAVVGTVMQGPGGGRGSGSNSGSSQEASTTGIRGGGEILASPSSLHATRASSSIAGSFSIHQQPDTVLGGNGMETVNEENSNTAVTATDNINNNDSGAGTRVASSVDLLLTTAPESLATSGRQTRTLGASPAASTLNIEGLGENIPSTSTAVAAPVVATASTPTTSAFPTMPRLPLQNLAALQAAAATPRVDYSARTTTRTTTHPQIPAEIATVLAPAAAAMALQGISTDAAAVASSWQRQKIYMDTLSIAPIEVTLSFLSSPVHHYVASHPRLATLQRLLSLVDVEDAQIWLAGLNLLNPLMDAEALSQALQRHYLRSLIPELYKVIGSASMIGDPVSLLQHLGAGVWTFVSAPAEGLLASARALGPRQFLLGVLRGTQGLLLNVVFAISNATTKAAGAARKAIVVWGLDRQDEPLGAGSFRRRVVFIEGGGLRRGYDGQGEDALLSAVLRGLAGLISEPIRGVEEAGLVGLIKGIQRGALRAVALPLAVLLEMSARFADSVRRAVAGSSNLGWLRPPRHVSPSEALAPYDWSSAMGRWLLTELQTVEAHVAARRREKMAANHHYHHLNYHSSTSGRSSVASNGTTTTASSFGASGSSGRDDYSGSGSVAGAAATALSSSYLPSTSSLGAVSDVETFLLCVPTTTTTATRNKNGCYLVLTSKRVLYVRAKGLMWEPDVQWQGAMCDLELVSHIYGESAVRFVANPPPLKVAAPLSLLLPSSLSSSSSGLGGGRKNGKGMFSYLRIDCEDAETAEKVKNVTHKAMKAAVPRGGLLCL